MTDSGASAREKPDHDLFGGYTPPGGFHDEMFGGDSQARPHWQAFHEAITGLGEPQFGRQWEQAQRQVRENGIAFSAYGDPADKPRPWELDPLPVLITASEWASVSAALQQRACLLNLILTDLWGDQTLLTRGLLPPEVVFAHPGFLRPFHGRLPSDEGFLHFYAADLGRSPDGQVVGAGRPDRGPVRRRLCAREPDRDLSDATRTSFARVRSSGWRRISWRSRKPCTG